MVCIFSPRHNLGVSLGGIGYSGQARLNYNNVSPDSSDSKMGVHCSLIYCMSTDGRLRLLSSVIFTLGPTLWRSLPLVVLTQSATRHDWPSCFCLEVSRHSVHILLAKAVHVVLRVQQGRFAVLLGVAPATTTANWSNWPSGITHQWLNKGKEANISTVFKELYKLFSSGCHSVLTPSWWNTYCSFYFSYRWGSWVWAHSATRLRSQSQ